MDKIYFKNFNAFRAIAASLVVFAHIIQHKKDFLPSFNNLIPIGTISVTFFFVLSGFLITYLLLKEKEKTQSIDFKKFYYRRILRIWPLYFATLIVGFILFYNQIELKALILSVFFLPNVALTYNMLPDAIDPIWSIGIEEQFYLFLPWLTLLINPVKKLARVLVIIIGLFIFLKLFSSLYNSIPVFNFINDYLYLARFDSMLIGSLGAIWYFNRNSSSGSIIFSPVIQVLVFLILLSVLYSNFYLNLPIIHPLYSILFLLIIINGGINPRSIINLDNKIMNHLGKLSYGLYLTHKLTLFFVFDFCFQISGQNMYLTLLLAYFASLIVSQLSYLIIEKFFLHYKSKFEVMRTSS